MALLVQKASAQTNASIWERGKSGSQSVKSKSAKRVTAVKSWKDRIEKWGLDTNYTHSLAAAGRLNSDGWSAGLVYGHKKQNGRLPLWQLTFSEVKDEKETNQQGTSAFPQFGSGTPYIFGKINNLYLLQLGYGGEKILLPALLYGNVAIGIRYSGGILIAMLKPYYLYLIYSDYSTSPATIVMKEEAYSEQNKEQFLDRNVIIGKVEWTRGLGNMNYLPGIYSEISLAIIPKNTKRYFERIILGSKVSLYSNKLSLINNNQNSLWELALFSSIEIGKTWK